MRAIIVVTIFLVFLISGCKERYTIDALASDLVDSIRKKDAEAYYSLFPDSEYVARYGIFAYGLYPPHSEEDWAFWRRPFPQFKKSIDSLEKITKPEVIHGINKMFDEFHTEIAWDNIKIESIDTVKTRISETGNGVKRVKQIHTDMTILLNTNEEKYELKCRGIVKNDDDSWFLREASSRVELIKRN